MVKTLSRQVFCALFLASLVLSPRLDAEQTRSSEYDIKAAYLYNFAKFVQWPTPASPDSNAGFCIAVLGEDPFGSGLDGILANKQLQDKPLTIRHLRDAGEAASCQVLFISDSEEKHLDRIFTTLAGSPVLTVGNNPAFVRKGGMLGFLIVHNNVRFNVNLKAAENAHLQISSQLLKVANAVNGASEGVSP